MCAIYTTIDSSQAYLKRMKTHIAKTKVETSPVVCKYKQIHLCMTLPT